LDAWEEEEEDVLLRWSLKGTSRYCTYVGEAGKVGERQKKDLVFPPDPGFTSIFWY
jgi:hypothetical protein